MSAPTLSVLLPIHDTAPYLRQALDSLLAQTFADFEIIAVNDGSSDDSGAILDEYARTEPRLRVVHQKNSGIVVALNRALGEARAEILARMDGDDVALPLRFERQLDYLKQHPHCVLLGTAALVVDEDGDPVSPMPIGFGHAEIDRLLLEGRGSTILHPTAMLRRAAVLEAGGYQRGLEGAEDLDLYLRLAELGEVANLSETLLHFRKRASSVTANTTRYGAWQLQQTITARARQRRRLPPQELPVNHIWRPRGPDELTFWLAVQALRSGFPHTASKHARRLLLRPDGPAALTRILSLSLGPHLARKYYRVLRGLSRTGPR